MIDYISLFLGADHQMLNLGVTATLWVGLAALGSLVAGRRVVGEGAFIYGWGFAATIVTMGGLLLSLPLSGISWAMFILAAAALVLVWNRDGVLLPSGMVKLVVLALPLLLLTSAMLPSQWDEFSHWLPAPRFLMQTDAFPGSGNPVTGTPMLPAYPYNWPLVSFWSGLLAGEFLHGPARLFNVLMMMSIGLLAFRLCLRAAGRDENQGLTWAMAALALLAGTLLNPAFVQKIVLTAYADICTAVIAALLGYVGWRWLDRLAADDRAGAWALSWQFSLASLALINIKQVNLVYFLLVLGGMGLAGLRDPSVRLSAMLRHLPLMVIPSLLVYLQWRHYVAAEMYGWSAEATFMPFKEWDFGLVPAILTQMLVVAGKKFAFYGLMALSVVFAAIGLFRFKGEFDRLSIIVGTTFVGYMAFMVFIYVTHFGGHDARRVVSFWRYSSHVAPLGVLFGAYGVGLLWKRFMAGRKVPTAVGLAPIILVLLAPMVFAHKLRFDYEPPKPGYIGAAVFAAEHLPRDAQFRVLDPQGDGESSVFTRFWTDRNDVPFSTWRTLSAEGAVTEFVAPLEDGAWLAVHSTSEETERALGLQLQPDVSYIMIREKGAWKILRSWQQKP